jgi:hypothetical protein
MNRLSVRVNIAAVITYGFDYSELLDTSRYL